MLQWLTHCQKCYYPVFEKYLLTACSITRGRLFPFQQILLHFPGWADLVPAHRHFILCVLGDALPRPSLSCVRSGPWCPLHQDREEAMPHSPPQDLEPALRKQNPPTSPSTLRLRSLFPGPFLVTESVTGSTGGTGVAAGLPVSRKGPGPSIMWLCQVTLLKQRRKPLDENLEWDYKIKILFYHCCIA